MSIEIDKNLTNLISALNELGVTNTEFDPTITRGFNYYTGIVFEIFDTSEDNNRSLLGGGRYNNLTEMFGGDKISGIGFGMGDVTMMDFLTTHNLLTSNITSPTLMILPTDPSKNHEAQKIAHKFRTKGITVATDISEKKLSKKIASASDRIVQYIMVVGNDELETNKFTLKDLVERNEESGTVNQLITKLTQ